MLINNIQKFYLLHIIYINISYINIVYFLIIASKIKKEYRNLTFIKLFLNK
jgi:hypothetical protein